MQDALRCLEAHGVSIHSDGRERQQVELLADILKTLNRIEEALAHPVYNLTIDTRE